MNELEVIGGKLRIVNFCCGFEKISFLKRCLFIDYNTVELYDIHIEDTSQTN